METEKTPISAQENEKNRILDAWAGPIPGYFEVLRERLASPEYMMSIEEQEIPEGCWQCFDCRTINNRNFCTECGKKRPDNVK